MILGIIIGVVLTILFAVWTDLAYSKGFKDAVNETKNKFGIEIKKNEDSRNIR